MMMSKICVLLRGLGFHRLSIQRVIGMSGVAPGS